MKRIVMFQTAGEECMVNGLETTTSKIRERPPPSPRSPSWSYSTGQRCVVFRSNNSLYIKNLPLAAAFYRLRSRSSAGFPQGASPSLLWPNLIDALYALLRAFSDPRHQGVSQQWVFSALRDDHVCAALSEEVRG